MAFIEIRNLKKYFKASKGLLHAVDDVSLDIEKGKTIGVVGESGCGKSTLGRVIMRLLEPTSGSVMFEGADVANCSMREFTKNYRSKIQMIFQDPYSSMDPRMSVAELIKEPLIVSKKFNDKNKMNDEVKRMMDQVGLASRLVNTYPHELDGGRRQRIGIARALALNPDFIICDEPVSALDVSIQAQVLNLLMDLQKEKNLTYMFITHNLSVVRHISNEIAVMYLGQVVEKCPSKELFITPLHPYSKALLSAIPIPNTSIKKEQIILKGELTSPINPKKCCRFAPRCLHATEKCFAEEPQLIEYSPNHFAACHFAGKF